MLQMVDYLLREVVMPMSPAHLTACERARLPLCATEHRRPNGLRQVRYAFQTGNSSHSIGNPMSFKVNRR